jgi:hypothetical protein
VTTVRKTEYAKVYTLCDLPNSVYLNFILSCIHSVFNTCIWSIRSKPVACVEGNNKISFDGCMSIRFSYDVPKREF